MGLPCLPGKSPRPPLINGGNRGETMAIKVRWFCIRRHGRLELCIPVHHIAKYIIDYSIISLYYLY